MFGRMVRKHWLRLLICTLLLIMLAGCGFSLLPNPGPGTGNGAGNGNGNGSGSGNSPVSGSGPVGDESMYWHFKVIVRDWNEQPIAGVLVELCFDDELQYSGYTDESGEVEFNYIDLTGRLGWWLARVSKDGETKEMSYEATRGGWRPIWETYLRGGA